MTEYPTPNCASRLISVHASPSFQNRKERNSAMPQTLEAELMGVSVNLKEFSCLTCRQRKIKCDRRNPCSNCVKAAKQCSFVLPGRGRQRSKKAPKEGLHAKLRRYEEILKSYGAKIDPSGNSNTSDVESVSEPDVEMAEDVDSRNKSRNGPFTFDETKTRLINKNGPSRYLDKYVCYYSKSRGRSWLNSHSGLWSNAGDEVSLRFPHGYRIIFFSTIGSLVIPRSKVFLKVWMDGVFRQLTSLLILLKRMASC